MTRLVEARHLPQRFRMPSKGPYSLEMTAVRRGHEVVVWGYETELHLRPEQRVLILEDER